MESRSSSGTGQEEQAGITNSPGSSSSLLSLPYTDFGARQYSPTLSRWLVPDPMSEKYYDVSPYAYCANDPVNVMDPQGDTLVVSSENQQLFQETLKDVFGEHSKDFSFDSKGVVCFSGNIKHLNRRQRKVMRGMQKLMSQQKITEIQYGESITIGNTSFSTNNTGGALSILSNNNILLISPNAPNSVNVYEVTDAYYINEIDPSNGDRFIPKTIETNITDRTFHEIGHAIYDGMPQDKVLKYNNYVRSLLGLRRRRPDEEHNLTRR